MLIHSVSSWGAAHARTRDVARPDLVERRLRRYCGRYAARVRALADRDSRLADLALSFPALLFALAVPRPGFDPKPGIARVLGGASLAELAAHAQVPTWLRRMPPEAFVRPIPVLPDGKLFARRIVNHIPRSPKLMPVWLQTVAAAAECGHEALAVWLARELLSDPRTKLDRLRLISLFAWFSGQPGTKGCDLIARRWDPDKRFATALDTAEDWRTRIVLHVNLGDAPIRDMWLPAARICGFDFVPLRSAADIEEEATAMRNCVRDYASGLAHNWSRLWSVQQAGRRVATLSVGMRTGDPIMEIFDLKAAGNEDARLEVWLAAREWLHLHDPGCLRTNRCAWDRVPLDPSIWRSLWRPYWLAKRRLPEWLPLRPSRWAVRAL